jgi:hypothetical protein
MVKRKIIWSPDANLDFLSILEYFQKRNGSKTYSKITVGAAHGKDEKTLWQPRRACPAMRGVE